MFSLGLTAFANFDSVKMGTSVSYTQIVTEEKWQLLLLCKFSSSCCTTHTLACVHV